MTKTRLTQLQIDEMAFGQLVVMGAKQDAAAVIKDMTTTGMCCAAMVPEDACLAALDHSVKNVQTGLTNSSDNAEVLICGSVLPFSQELAGIADRGIRAILQPGGAPNDDEFIKFCNDRGIAMVFTGIEHSGC
jgi:phosphoribosylaminoimidazolecarboxamide formyltransferase/IMP cyclohydrolase